jgi:hypothetical protein
VPRFYAITILIAGKIYDFVVLLAQGLVVLYLFALRCKRSPIEARGKSGANANAKRKYSIFGCVVPRRAEFRQIARKPRFSVKKFEVPRWP